MRRIPASDRIRADEGASLFMSNLYLEHRADIEKRGG